MDQMNDMTPQKSRKSIAAIVSMLIAIALLVCALIPMEQVRRTPLRLPGTVNVIFGVCGLIAAIVTIVLAVRARKHAKKKGAGTLALVVGILTLIGSMVIAPGTCVLSIVTDYANHGLDSALGKIIADRPDDIKKFDDMIDDLLNIVTKEKKEVPSVSSAPASDASRS